MRTLKLQVQATVDGFMGGPNGEMDPAAIGHGMSIFGGLDTRQDLTLLHTKAFDCGIVVVCYQPKQA